MIKDDLEIFIDQKKAESPEFAENFEEGYLKVFGKLWAFGFLLIDKNF